MAIKIVTQGYGTAATPNHEVPTQGYTSNAAPPPSSGGGKQPIVTYTSGVSGNIVNTLSPNG